MKSFFRINYPRQINIVPYVFIHQIKKSFCPHIHGFLSILSPPEIQQHTGSQKYNIGKNRSLNAKTNIICKTVSCCRCIQLKYRIRYVDSAIWQPKENVLCEIPRSMYGKCAPETVHIIYHERK